MRNTGTDNTRNLNGGVPVIALKLGPGGSKATENPLKRFLSTANWQDAAQ